MECHVNNRFASAAPCETICGKRKGDDQDWLLGFEVSGGPTKVMKYAINLLGQMG
jgi:hypothetical protein